MAAGADARAARCVTGEDAIAVHCRSSTVVCQLDVRMVPARHTPRSSAVPRTRPRAGASPDGNTEHISCA